MGAHQQQGKLAGEQFVIGQPPPCRRVGSQIGFAVRAMGGVQRRAPAGPPLLLEPCRIAPFVKLRRPFQCALDGAAERPRRQPGGQRVNRLDGLQIGDLIGCGDVVRVGDLKPALPALDAPADHPHLAFRQHPLQVVGTGMEEHQVQLSGVVAARDLVRQAPGARRLVGTDAERHGGDGAGRGVGDLGCEAPVDQAARQVPQQVHHVRPREVPYHGPDPRPDAGQRRHRREQRKQDFWTHGGFPTLEADRRDILGRFPSRRNRPAGVTRE